MIKVGKYRVKKMYELKGRGVGWYIYSRHILGRNIGHVDVKSLGPGLRNQRRFRVSDEFASKEEAIAWAKILQMRSDKIILPMVG